MILFCSHYRTNSSSLVKCPYSISCCYLFYCSFNK
nr:MAG TPA: hypothetical protein [Caudoviricetes sp.]DAR12701.1 MAG TPA: hypothetical protein [Crassvirales sp.]